MKKILCVLLSLSMVFAVAACGSTATSEAPASEAAMSEAAASGAAPAEAGGPVAPEDLLIGVVHPMDPSDQGYTFNHDLGTKYMLEELGLSEDQYIPKFNVSDQDPAAIRAAIQELVEAGCQIIFTTTYSYNATTTEMARENPNVQFCHASGTDAHFEDLPNLHNYYAKIHEGRYLAGVVAGMKAQEIGNPQLGYVAAVPFSSVISGYTAFFLGAQSVYPEVTMDVIYLGSWGDPQVEKEVAERLLNSGAGVISQHTDSTAPALAAEEAGAFHVGYNTDMSSVAPNASLTSTRINWGIYMTEAVQAVIDGGTIPVDWSEGIIEGAAVGGAVDMFPLNTDIVAEGTQEELDAAIESIISGENMIFQGALKNQNGDPLEIYNFDGDVIFTFEDENSVFDESGEFSAPAFNPGEGNSLEGINVLE